MGGARIRVLGPKAGECTPVVVTARFQRESLRSRVALYVDGARAGAAGLSAPPAERFVSQATVLGGDPEGERGFAGRLLHPALFNRDLRAAEVAALSSELCPSPPSSPGT